ncbi:uncharacterized protein LOC114519072 [Dendronephthya gigantea]|uniref:uncharacterized protein LOC114519072 n=1 Tax=Dendronephthya gigantea TaxID=151771 RepID=UPI0010695F7D|nr:uncharacterized protein LOC114519072 [Dendronephthya gigantea]
MGCPMSKRVQTSSETNTSPVQITHTSPNTPDENSNGVLRPPQPRRPLSNYDNCNSNGVKHLQNIPGQINNPLAPVILKNRPSTRTQSQVEFFAMLDSKIEAGADLRDEER